MPGYYMNNKNDCIWIPVDLIEEESEFNSILYIVMSIFFII